MHRPIFEQFFAVLVAPILLFVLALYFLNKKKPRVRRDAEDADPGTSGSLISLGKSNSGACSSSTVPTGDYYDVFLSFRGPDTREGFISHLYNGLVDAGIRTFRDDDELRQGEEIGPDLFAAIENSSILIPILSVNYGSSKWCLDELVHIIKCKKNNTRQIVLPIFYKVEPAHVRYQIGSFGYEFRSRFVPSEIPVLEFFRRIRNAFRAKSMRGFWRRVDPTILEKWMQALNKVSSLKGWEAKGNEGELVKLVVQEVLSELKKNFELDIPENLVGIDNHVEKIMKFLDSDSNATLFVGIHGVGGIGKTTLAKTIYNKLSGKFEYRSYIPDIRALCERHGLEYLQNQLISSISKQRNQVFNKDEGIKFISSKFKGKKVLLLLDDVDDDNQWKALAGNHNWFYSGSRIFITTRNKRILDNAGVDYNYEHEELEQNQSLILFSRHAFRRSSPPRNFEKLARQVVFTTGGLPLCLEVLGSLLYNKELPVWRDTIEKLRKVSHKEVRAKLRISYETLDYGQQQIFLDVACFLVGTDVRIASYMWKACDFFPNEGIEALRLMSLVKVGDDHELRMHDQLRDLGKEIVREENQHEPQYRSRLWDYEEIMEVLKENKGTRNIRAIYLSRSSSKWSGKIADQDGNIHIDGQFKNLTNLRFLHLSGAHFSGDFKNSLEKLRWLRWRNCPLTFEANVKELLVLDLSRSEISDKWGGWSFMMMAKKLKFLDLTRCRSLRSTVFLSAFKSLEILILRHCEELEQIDFSIGDMKGLARLELTGCKRLKELPYNLGALQNLEVLNIRKTGIKKLPHGIGSLRKLQDLDASSCRNLGEEMPESIRNLSSLKRLNLEGCEELRLLPELPSSLTFLSITCHGRRLPSLSHLAHLKELQLIGCKFLECLPELPSTLSELSGCSQLTDVEESELPRSLNTPFKLEILKIWGCKLLETLDVSQLDHLRELSVENCNYILEVQGLDKLKYLERLTISICDSMKRLDLSKSEALKILHVAHCNNLVEVPSLRRVEFLEMLHIKWCTSIKMLDLSESENLKKLTVEDCENLVEIQGLDRLKFLELLSICKCNSIERLKLPESKSPRKVEIQICESLVEIQSLNELEFLLELFIYTCASIKMLDLSKFKGMKKFRAFHCENLVEIQGFDRLELLELLEIRNCPIERVDVGKLKVLKKLCAQGCKNLVEIQGLDRLEFLEVLDICECNSIKMLNLSKLKGLEKLFASDCKNLIEIQGLDRLEFLKVLNISGCTSVERLPNLCCFDSLQILAISRCDKLHDIHSLERFPSCTSFGIKDCKSLAKLPNLSNFYCLQKLFLSNCHELREIPGLEESTSLQRIAILGCSLIEILPDFSSCTNLISLVVQNCERVTELRGLEKLEQLVELDISGCKSLKTIPELPGTQLYRNYERKPSDSDDETIEFGKVDLLKSSISEFVDGWDEVYGDDRWDIKPREDDWDEAEGCCVS